MLETVVITELVLVQVPDTVASSDIELSVVETAGSDVVLATGEPTPEIIEVA